MFPIISVHTEAAMLTMDQILASNELTMAATAAMPAMVRTCVMSTCVCVSVCVIVIFMLLRVIMREIKFTFSWCSTSDIK